jgi:signal transduction histidine kinase
MELERAPLEPVALVDDLLELSAESAQARGLSLSAAIAPDLPPVLLGDITRLRQIVGNLVGNATKFTHSGFVVVRLGLCAPPPDRPLVAGTVWVRCEVEDSGIGITDAQLERLFTSFSQARALFPAPSR